MMMKYSVIIPTNRKAREILPTLRSLGLQSILPERVFLLYDRKVDKKEFSTYQHNIQNNSSKTLETRISIISEHTADFKAGQGVSYVRNYGISCVQTPYLLSVDDDNTFTSEFINSLAGYSRELDKPGMLIPTEHHEGRIRSRGYRGFSYFLGIQLPCKKKGTLVPIQFAASNCLFGPTNIFQEIQFDPQMQFVYEDFDMTRRVSKVHGLYVTDTIISHNMQPRTALQDTYVDTPFRAQQKAKNRIIFVQKNSSKRQRFLYSITGLHIHTLFLLMKVLVYPAPDKGKILQTIFFSTYKTFFNPPRDLGKK